jgi:hypothetical protein
MNGPIVTHGWLARGQRCVRGTVLGQRRSDGCYRVSCLRAKDGSQYPVGILAKNCDATARKRRCLVYRSGSFNGAKLVFGTGHSVRTVRRPLLEQWICIVRRRDIRSGVYR